MAPAVAASTVTGVGASASEPAGFLAHPAASTTAASKQTGMSFLLLSNMLKRSHQDLQVSLCSPIANQSIIIGVARLRGCILRIHHFKRGGFAGLIAPQHQAQ